MKPRFWFLVMAAVALFACASATAQGCFVSYDPSFSVWEDLSMDATNIYTEVGMDGYGTMTIEGQCYDLPYIEHSAYLWNSVGSASSGWVPAGDYCPDCYVSAEQGEETPYSPNQTYDFSYEGQMWCNIGGNFFDAGDFLGLSVSVATYFIRNLNGDGTSTYDLTCPQNTAATCGQASGVFPFETNWVEQFELYYRFLGLNPVCIPPAVFRIGFDGDPAPLPCT